MDQAGIYVGRKFNSFEELETFIKQYESENNFKFWVRSSRSVDAAKKVLRRPLNDTIKYYELQYSCIHGGLDFKARNIGIRRRVGPKMDCPAKIKLRATPDGNCLEIRSFVLNHEGHDHCEDLHNLSLSRRKKLRAKQHRKYLLLNKKRKEGGEQENNIKEADFRYLYGKTSKGTPSENQDDILKALHILKEDYCASATVLYNEASNFRAMYFTTTEMQKSLQAWYDVISIWGIYNWLNKNYTILLVSVKDSNGMNDIVAVGVIGDDNKDALNWFLQTFKSDTTAASLDIRYIMGEKHLVEGQLKSVFPNVVSHVSVYYSLKSFQRIINSENFLITRKERDHCMELFTKLVFSKSFSDYNSIYSTFCKTAPKCVVDYFNEDWEPNRNDWAVYKMERGTLIDACSKTEALDNRLKQVIAKGSSIIIFVKQLFNWLKVQNYDKKHKASLLSVKKINSPLDKCTVEEQYSNYLTHYAYSFVYQQLEFMNSTYILEEINDDVCITQEDTVLYPATVSSCECRDWVSMMLPCRHIFIVRKAKKLPLYCEELCNQRWTKEYYLKVRLDIDSNDDNEAELESSCSSEIHVPKMSTHEDMERAVTVTNQLLDLLSTESDELKFHNKICLLGDVVCLWNKGYDVKIAQTSIPLSPSQNNQTVPSVVFCDNATINASPSPQIDNVDSLGTYETSITITTSENEQKCNVVPTTVVPVNQALPETGMTRKIMKFDLQQYGFKNIPLKFSLKSKNEQIKMILTWIVHSEMLHKIGEGYIFDMTDIELRPNFIQHSILHESVDMFVVKPYITEDAFDNLLLAIQAKRESEIWLCHICEMQLDEDSVLCASCLLWFHPKCVGLSGSQKRKNWFCFNCLSSA